MNIHIFPQNSIVKKEAFNLLVLNCLRFHIPNIERNKKKKKKSNRVQYQLCRWVSPLRNADRSKNFMLWDQISKVEM